MRMPEVQTTNKRRTFMYNFLGYNHNLVTESGNNSIEFYNMKNMDLNHYPVISTRQGEKDERNYPGTPNGLHEYKEDTIMAVCGDRLYVGITSTSGGEIVPNSTELLTASEKSFATIGAYTVIMPDKVVYNAETGVLTKIVQSYQGEKFDGCWLILQEIPCEIDGTEVEYVSQSTAPEDQSVYWYDTAHKIWRKYSTSSDSWIKADTTYVKLLPCLSGSKSEYVVPDYVPEEAQEALDALSGYFGTLTALDTFSYKRGSKKLQDYIVMGAGEDELEEVSYVVVVSTSRATVVNSFTIGNRCPNLDHLVSLNNRVWGVDNEKHELYACKLGNPMQWYNYADVAADSYAVSLGFADEVTGSAAYNNYVHFFTEGKIIKIYGDYPSNYQLHTTNGYGVISGGHDTIVQVEGFLFWVSPVGVVSYDGAMPYIRGQQLGPNFLDGKTVVAGRDGTKYCLSVSENGTALGVYVYDTQFGLWCVGGDQIFAKTAQMNNALCILNKDSRVITLYDRSRETDYSIKKGTNVMDLDRTEADY